MSDDAAIKHQAVFGSFRYEMTLAALVLISDKMEEMDLETILLIHRYAGASPENPIIMSGHVRLALQVKALRPIWKAEEKEERRIQRKKMVAPKRVPEEAVAAS